MFVPYGDQRAPYPRKAAFDLGNDGAGTNANNLKLGCDCLGEQNPLQRSINPFLYHSC